ncbi:hypothetical protein C8F04DRAFT_189317 [Mycena alexandri]|uniref:Uncharacterized protein n=1 Tax=Mycena alexandri TaxID=1745969 RepID=A0AAD6WSD8_9AGAR|nr:hypothetical protein C8F04DRAFT_189317 [Mycena alexandri]
MRPLVPCILNAATMLRSMAVHLYPSVSHFISVVAVPLMVCKLVFILRMHTTDSGSEADSDGNLKRKRRPTQPKPPKRQSTSGKDKGRAIESDSDSDGIRITARPERRRGGIFVDEVIHLESDVSATPELLHVDGQILTVDGYVKKEV